MIQKTPIPIDKIESELSMLEVFDVELEIFEDQLVGISLHDIGNREIFHFDAISLSSRVWGADGLGVLEVSVSKVEKDRS